MREREKVADDRETDAVGRREKSDVGVGVDDNCGRSGRVLYTRGKSTGYTCDTYAGKAMGKGVWRERGRGVAVASRRASPPQICAAAPNQTGGKGGREEGDEEARNPPSVNILCHRVTLNAESPRNAVYIYSCIYIYIYI